MALDILVVDDIPDSRQALCEQVTALGHTAQGVANGQEALAAVRQRLPDLMLIDLLMPGLDGFELTRLLRELTADRWVPLIATSSLQGDEHVIAALHSGADDYLSRPVSPALLEAKLRHYGAVLDLQQRLARLAQRQRDILDNILDPVLTLDASGSVIEFNRAAHGLQLRNGLPLVEGASCEGVFGIHLDELLTLREGKLVAEGGREFPAELGLSQWREGDELHYTVVLRDLTERRQIDRMKDEFLATVSHELRTPLTSVMGALGLLSGGAAGALPPGAAPLAEVARRNGERLGRLIDDILDLTKLEGDRMALHLRPQALAPLLQESINANLGYAAQGQVQLLLEHSELAVPEVALDADRFLQVMANLLSNAIKHSPPNEAVRVSLYREGPSVCITVRDRGPGIAPQFRARMFEKFSQADGTDRRAQGGTGLGLYITRMLVERMGGRISADEVQGEGSAFTLRFPAAALVLPARPVVLHIESDFEIRARIARWLAPHFQVEGAATLAQAQLLVPSLAPVALIGNPQSQGSADGFCAQLQQLAGARPVLLLGDSIDQAFSDRLGLPWRRLAGSDANDLLRGLQDLLRAPLSEKGRP